MLRQRATVTGAQPFGLAAREKMLSRFIKLLITRITSLVVILMYSAFGCAGQPEPELTLDLGAVGAVNVLTYSPDGRYAAIGYDSDNFVYVWYTKTGSQIRKFYSLGRLKAGLLFSPDSQEVLVGDDDGDVRFFELASGMEKRVLHKSASYGVTSLSISDDGNRLLTGGHAPPTRLRETEIVPQLGLSSPHEMAGRASTLFTAQPAVPNSGRRSAPTVSTEWTAAADAI